MARLVGMWVLKREQSTLLARVQAELYLLAFSSAARAGACLRALGAEALPFYVCMANVDEIVRDARDSGARGFIVDYDAGGARFASAHPLPVDHARELR